MHERTHENQRYYGQRVGAQRLLSGEEPAPKQVQDLHALLELFPVTLVEQGGELDEFLHKSAEQARVELGIPPEIWSVGARGGHWIKRKSLDAGRQLQVQGNSLKESVQDKWRQYAAAAAATTMTMVNNATKTKEAVTEEAVTETVTEAVTEKKKIN